MRRKWVAVLVLLIVFISACGAPSTGSNVGSKLEGTGCRFAESDTTVEFWGCSNLGEAVDTYKRVKPKVRLRDPVVYTSSNRGQVILYQVD